MLSKEILKKVRRIELTTRKAVNDVMSGQYKSHFKGHGVQFSEHRQYVPGDDVRHIDWKVSARSRDPLIKKFEEERELTVLLLVDVSGSEQFGSVERLKSEILAELGGMIAYAAVHTGDKVGAMLFSSETEKLIPPRKGRLHVLRIISDLLTFTPQKKGTDLAGALESAERVMKHGGIVFILSDFMAQDYQKALKRLSRKHDVVAVNLSDPRESEVPNVGYLLIQDPETGEEAFVDTGSYRFKAWLDQERKNRRATFEDALKGAQVDVLELSSGEDYSEALVRFFRIRSKRRK